MMKTKSLWGGQSWPQPPFQAASPLKAGSPHDCPPSNLCFSTMPHAGSHICSNRLGRGLSLKRAPRARGLR